MADQERFDTLARGLATNRLSRGQVLKGLAAAFVGATLGTSLLPKEVRAAPCEPRYARPEWDPKEQANGCGAKGDPRSRKMAGLVERFSGANFQPGCNKHDICYATCNSAKSACDGAFEDALHKACKKAFPGLKNIRVRKNCRDGAATVGAAVRLGGQKAYDAAQAEACCCEDDFNCGSCGNVCDKPWGATCQNGECSCPPGQMDCGGICLGSENVPCDPPREFKLETCQCECPSGQTDCGGECVDTSTDKENCGGCGIACGSCQKCDNGVCRGPDQTQCEGCVDGEVTPPRPEAACFDPRTGGFLGCCAPGAVCGDTGWCCGEGQICGGLCCSSVGMCCQGGDQCVPCS